MFLAGFGCVQVERIGQNAVREHVGHYPINDSLSSY